MLNYYKMKNYLVTVLASFLLLFLPILNFAQAPTLGATSSFALFSGTGAFAVEMGGNTTTVTGNVGTHTGAYAAFPPGTLNGTAYVGVGDPTATLAAAAVLVAYGSFPATCDYTIVDGDLNNVTLTPGVYCLGSATTLDGVLTLDGLGDPNALFIFKIGGAISTNVGSTVNLINSASCNNVYWQVNGAVNLGGTSTFSGTIVAQGAINMAAGATLVGRGLTTAGAISLANSNVNVSIGSPPSASTISGPTTVCAGSSITLSGNIGGTWSNGLTSPTITISAAGNYFVTNTTPCGSVNSDTITVTVSSALSCTISGPALICQGSSTELCAPAGSSGYSWSTGGSTNCITVSATGTYTVTVTNNGCISICTKTVTVIPLAACTITGAGSICQGSSTQLCVPAGASAYLWSTGSTSNCISVSSAGRYSVTVTTNGCMTTCSKVVTVNPVPACAITGVRSICQGQSTQLCVPAGSSSYLWSTGATTNCISVSVAGTYTVTVTGANGCTSTCSKVLIVYPLPSCAITGPASICQGISAQLCAPAGSSGYLWSTGGTSNCITVNTAGTYSVTVTNGGGCTSICSKTLTLDMPLTEAIISAGGPTQFCIGNSVILSGNNNNGTWSNGAGTASSITVTASGEYFVTNTNSCGSVTSNHILVNVNAPTPSVITANDAITFCVGDSVTLSGNVNGTWSTGATTASIVVKTSGDYFVTNTDSCGTVSSNHIIVKVELPPAISTIIASGPTSFCLPDSVTLSGNVGGVWNTGATTPSIVVTTSGEYFVTTANSCATLVSNKIIVNVLLFPIPSVITSNRAVDTICVGDSIILSGNAGGTWNNGSTGATLIVKTTGTFFVTNSNVCDTVTSNIINVTVLEIPLAPAVLQDTICLGDEIILGNASITGNTYKWTTNYGLFISSLANPKVRPLGTTTYILQQSNGFCQASYPVKITVGPLPSCLIKGNNLICEGGSTELCAPAGAFTYRWNTGETTRCITVDSIGYYIVEVTNSFGCSSRCGRRVLRGEGPCDIVGSDLIYAGQSTQFCAPAGYSSYAWSSGETTRCITAKTAGTYSVTVTNAMGCVSICSKILTVEATVCEIIGDTLICPDTYATLCAVSRPGNTYYWNNGQTTQCIEINCQGTYSVQVTNSSANGIASSICVITVKNAPLLPRSLSHCIITGNLNPAQGQTTTLCAPAGYLHYLWSNGAVTSCITVNSGGTYAVRASNGGGCSHTCQVKVVYPSSNLNSLENRSTELPPVNNLKINAYPNPFNNVAHFEFQTGQTDSQIKVEVTGLTGNKIFTLFDGKAEKGQVYRVSMDGHFMAEGVYLYRIINGEQSITKKLVLIR